MLSSGKFGERRLERIWESRDEFNPFHDSPKCRRIKMSRKTLTVLIALFLLMLFVILISSEGNVSKALERIGNAVSRLFE